MCSHLLDCARSLGHQVACCLKHRQKAGSVWERNKLMARSRVVCRNQAFEDCVSKKFPTKAKQRKYPFLCWWQSIPKIWENSSLYIWLTSHPDWRYLQSSSETVTNDCWKDTAKKQNRREKTSYKHLKQTACIVRAQTQLKLIHSSNRKFRLPQALCKIPKSLRTAGSIASSERRLLPRDFQSFSLPLGQKYLKDSLFYGIIVLLHKSLPKSGS